MKEEFSFDRFNQWRKDIDNNEIFLNIWLKECLGVMNDYLYNVEKYLPIKYIFYLTFQRVDDKSYLVFNGRIVDVFGLSLEKLYREILEDLKKNPNFVGLLSKDFEIDSYMSQLKELYPDEEIILNVAFVNQMRQAAGMTPLTSEDFKNH